VLARLNSKLVTDLKKLLGEHGMKTSGLKKELIFRLLGNDPNPFSLVRNRQNLKSSHRQQRPPLVGARGPDEVCVAP
jgi:hypothetical protein